MVRILSCWTLSQRKLFLPSCLSWLLKHFSWCWLSSSLVADVVFSLKVLLEGLWFHVWTMDHRAMDTTVTDPCWHPRSFRGYSGACQPLCDNCGITRWQCPVSSSGCRRMLEENGAGDATMCICPEWAPSLFHLKREERWGPTQHLSGGRTLPRQDTLAFQCFQTWAGVFARG